MLAPMENPQLTPLDLAARGFFLFPCDGKTPLVKWRRDSTTDPATVHNWMLRFPNCNWGVDCGKSGLAVLDVDSGKVAEAEANLRGLEQICGELPRTFKARTISGGYHLYYHGQIKTTAGVIDKGLDTRGAGGYVVAPCSKGYSVVEDLQVVNVPEWLIDSAGKPTERDEQPATPSNVILDTPFSIKRAVEYLKQAAPAVEGDGGDTWTIKVGCRVRDFGISQGMCIYLMCDHWNARNLPPWTEDDLAVKVANSYAYAQNMIGCADPVNAFTEFVEPQPERAPSLFIEANTLLAREIKIDYLVDGLIETPTTGLIFGDPSAGKSFLAISMAMAVACGTSWMGQSVKQGIAVYFAGEGRNGIQRRMEAWRRHYEIDIPENHLWVSDKRIDFSQQSLAKASDEMKRIQDKTGLPVSLCGVDTLARHMPNGLDENSAKDMGVFVNNCDWLRDLFHCVLLVVHHSGKMNKGASRGSSALKGAMDWEMKAAEEKNTTVRSLIFTKQKEGQKPAPMGFLLQNVNIGVETTSAVPIRCDYIPANGKLEGATEGVRKAFEALQMVLSTKGGGGGATLKEWKKAFFASLGDDTEYGNKRTKFSRAKDKLIEEGLIDVQGDTVFDISLDEDDNED